MAALFSLKAPVFLYIKDTRNKHNFPVQKYVFKKHTDVFRDIV